LRGPIVIGERALLPLKSAFLQHSLGSIVDTLFSSTSNEAMSLRKGERPNQMTLWRLWDVNAAVMILEVTSGDCEDVKEGQAKGGVGKVSAVHLDVQLEPRDNSAVKL
jgi:hypothetical protein